MSFAPDIANKALMGISCKSMLSPTTTSIEKAPHRDMHGHIPAHSWQSNFFHKRFQVPFILLHFGMSFGEENFRYSQSIPHPGLHPRVNSKQS